MSESQTSMSQRRNELLADVVDLVTRVLVDEEIAPELSELVANAVGDRLADYWGGQVISYPKDFRRALAKIELEIYRSWSEDGATYGELAKRYRMHERSMRRLIARVRARVTADEQQGLFEGRSSR